MKIAGNCMLDERKILIDTNILIYFLDSGDSVKNEKSREILQTIFNSDIGVISIQNLAELNIVCKISLDFSNYIYFNWIYKFLQISIRREFS